MGKPFLSIAAQVGPAVAGLDAAAKRQVPFALAKAVNELAFRTMDAERDNIRRTFKNPRQFTQRSVRVGKASKGSPTATVFVRPEAARYLKPFEDGGRHVLPGSGRALLNPKALRLDRFGQIRGKPSAIGSRAGVFVGEVQTKAGPVWGFWQRVRAKRGGKPTLKLLVRAGEALEVKQHLHFRDRAREFVAANAGRVLSDALAQALASARR